MENNSNEIRNFYEKLKETAKLYETHVIPYYSALISLNGGVKPLALLIESENFLTHLFNAVLCPETEDTNFKRATAHIERMILDLYKLLWREINLKLEQQIKVDVLFSTSLKNFKENEGLINVKIVENFDNLLFWIEENVLFYNPLEGTLRPQSRLIQMAIEEIF